MIRDHMDDILKCTRCGRCRALCPVNEELGWESTNARGRMLLARALAEGVPPSEAMRTSFYTCLSCAMCTATCPSGAKPDEVVEAARREMVAAGMAPPYYGMVRDNILTTGNPLGERGSRTAWAPAGAKGRSDLIFFAGCLLSYREQKAAQTTFRLLSRFGAKLLEDEQCCGSPLLRLGGEPVTLEHNLKQIRQSGAKTIVTSCAGCFKTLSEAVPDVEVLHVTQFLARKIDDLGLRQLPIKVSYHDPCHLGRCMNVYEEPRTIISKICELREMATSRQDARCCGGGGGVRRGYHDMALAIAGKRLREAPADVDYIVTACPMCNANLGAAGGKVIDICELIELALEPQERVP
ncbi:MAG: CoB--CoM heterodisulfide reductase iron-sulfur subunit D [Methanocella sp. PtaU1.Bin125]|nr:MAG: CoB--CoM heterodisulfide reductase iron-sulfur subunit D [Methanocella sp. PtaU1.Bin125]